MPIPSHRRYVTASLATFFLLSGLQLQTSAAYDGTSLGKNPQKLTIDPHYVPCWRSRGALRLGLKELYLPGVPTIDKWSPVMGDDVPLSDAQLAWLTDDKMLERRFASELKARGGKVFAGLMGTGIGIGASMIGWTLFGMDRLPPEVTLPISIGGLAIATAAILFTTWVLQQPFEPYLTPTPRHRLTRKEAYELVSSFNRYQDMLLCREARNLPLVTKSQPEPVSSAVQITITDEHILLDQQQMSLDSLNSALAPKQKTAVIIRVSTQAQAGLVLQVVDLVRTVGFSRVAIEEMEK